MALLALALSSAAGAAPPDLAACRSIPDDTQRLRCYDALAAEAKPSAEAAPASAAGEPAADSARPEASSVASQLEDRWELAAESRRESFTVRPHKQTYFLAGRYSNSPNERPSPVGADPAAAPTLDLESIEAKFQLSLKLKVASGILGDGNLWFAYTQQSHWQVYNEATSRPFRETNYEPEVMLAFPTNYSLLGLQGRLLNFGFVHQSNGRSEPLSRSWNRAYVQVGLERGNLALLVRPWFRIPESTANDDNPQIADYVGRGDLVAVARLGEQRLSLLVRNNLRLDPNRGSLQLDWSFPFYRGLKGYVQLFSGYGESLIDYNHRQTTLGVGVLLYDWL